MSDAREQLAIVKNRNHELHLQITKLREAMTTFVERCERGEVYAQFKELLEQTK